MTDAGAAQRIGTRVCANCGAPIDGQYCGECGQQASLHRSLRAFFADFANGITNFDGKIWRTLPLLVFRPGELTRRYIDGERVRFVSPATLYIFTVFAMFAVLNFNGALTPTLEVAQRNAASELAGQRASLQRLERQRPAAAARGPEAQAELDRRIASARTDIERLNGFVTSGAVVIDDGDFDATTPGWVRQLVKNVQSDPQAAIGRIQDAASKYSWALIPLSLPFMWLLFPFSSRFRLYDHSIFVTYSLAFMMMLVIASGALIAVGMPSIASLLFFVPPIHLYRQLRGTYGLGRWNALARTFVLLIFCFAAAGIFAAAMVAIGVF